MMGRPKRFTPELRERAVALVQEVRPSYHSDWAAITSVAQKIGCTRETLRKWTRQRQRDPRGLPASIEARLRELEREVRELRRANEILRRATLEAELGPGRSDEGLH